MSEVITHAVEAIRAKLSGGFHGSAKFVIEEEGAVLIDGADVRAATEGDDADVTMTASADTFQAILSGDMNPTMAFMSGKLKIEGDMGAAMRLGGVLG